MDNYSKLLLTIIAALLAGINVKLWQPQPPSQELPTFGDLMAAYEQQDRKTALDNIRKRIPLSHVQGGVEIVGNVDIDSILSPVDVMGSVNCY